MGARDPENPLFLGFSVLRFGRGVCETKSKNGRTRPRKPFISRVFCGSEKDRDHGVGVDLETVDQEVVVGPTLSICMMEMSAKSLRLLNALFIVRIGV